MLGSRGDDTVTCIACGAELARGDAREYDKLGDRWDRENKAFEYFCKPCDRRRCHQPRGDLEATLVESDAGEVDREVFLAQYARSVEERQPDGRN